MHAARRRWFPGIVEHSENPTSTYRNTLHLKRPRTQDSTAVWPARTQARPETGQVLPVRVHVQKLHPALPACQPAQPKGGTSPAIAANSPTVHGDPNVEVGRPNPMHYNPGDEQNCLRVHPGPGAGSHRLRNSDQHSPQGAATPLPVMPDHGLRHGVRGGAPVLLGTAHRDRGALVPARLPGKGRQLLRKAPRDGRPNATPGRERCFWPKRWKRRGR